MLMLFSAVDTVGCMTVTAFVQKNAVFIHSNCVLVDSVVPSMK